MIKNSLGRLRIISIFEGLSFLVLLGIAMPFKYILGEPLLVRYVGMAHGLLFMVFIAALLDATHRYQWSLKFSLTCFACSLVPLAPFWLESKLKKEAHAKIS